MTRPRGPSSPRVVERLWEAMRTARPAPPAPVACAEYDWGAPCRFTRRQGQDLQALGRAAAGKLSRGLSDLLGMPVKLEFSGFCQHYASTLRTEEAPPGQSRFSVRLDGADRSCGWIAVSPQTATRWVTRLLGGAVSGRIDSRPLSDLERGLLGDVSGVLADGLWQAFQGTGVPRLAVLPAWDEPGEPPSDPEGADVCRFLFCWKTDANRSGEEAPDAQEAAAPSADGPSQAPPAASQGADEAGQKQTSPPAAEAGSDEPAIVLVLSGQVAGALVDGKGNRGPKPAEAARRDMLEHVRGVPVRAESTVGPASVSVADLLALESGDVILLGWPLEATVQLAVQGRAVLAGTLASCEGHYALRVVGAPASGSGANQRAGAF